MTGLQSTNGAVIIFTSSGPPATYYPPQHYRFIILKTFSIEIIRGGFNSGLVQRLKHQENLYRIMQVYKPIPNLQAQVFRQLFKLSYFTLWFFDVFMEQNKKPKFMTQLIIQVTCFDLKEQHPVEQGFEPKVEQLNQDLPKANPVQYWDTKLCHRRKAKTLILL